MTVIAHKNRYESTLKKGREKKENQNFVEETSDYGIVIETSYKDAEVFYQKKILTVRLSQTFHQVCNKMVYPGDKVILNNKKDLIEKIIQRKNILSREKYDESKRSDVGTLKLVATNIDLALIVVSAQEPPLHPKLIDRYIILLQSNRIPFILVMNKCDLKTKREEQILSLYKDLGIRVVETSTKFHLGIEELKEVLKGKQSILVGHSGVGKSSLVNEIMKNKEIRVGRIGGKTKKGCHTTTSSRYYCWEESSSIIDTPGIRSLNLRNFKVLEIQDYFSEFLPFKEKCKYKNCLHYKENVEDCFVKQNIKNHFISKERYDSYVKIIEELYEKKKDVV